MKRNATIDMTHGPLLGKILLFSLPLMASNILQLLFNAADIVVVGRFAGSASLAAVSSTVAMINLFTQLLIGLSVGVNVVIARYLGLAGRSARFRARCTPRSRSRLQAASCWARWASCPRAGCLT